MELANRAPRVAEVPICVWGGVPDLGLPIYIRVSFWKKGAFPNPRERPSGLFAYFPNDPGRGLRAKQSTGERVSVTAFWKPNHPS